MKRAFGWLWIALLCVGLALSTGCGTPTYSSTSVGGYYGDRGWNDPYYDRPCCYGGYYPPNRPYPPPDNRPPGVRPPPGSRPPPGMRPPGAGRPPGGGRPPSMPSRPRPTPRGPSLR